jgi:hypothetical protein
MIIDSRGLVYGSLGMIEEALEDFRVVVPWLEDNPEYLSEDLIAMRQEWLTALEQGENPFTSEVLEQLRMDEMSPDAYPEPNLLDDFSRAHFVEILENDGFVFAGSESAENNNGIPYVAYQLVFDSCENMVMLFGSEDEIILAGMVLNNCSPNQTLAEMRWFARMLLFQNPWEDVDSILMGEYFAWELTTLNKLANDEISATGEFSLEELTFNARWQENPEGETNNLIITGGW